MNKNLEMLLWLTGAAVASGIAQYLQDAFATAPWVAPVVAALTTTAALFRRFGASEPPKPPAE